MAFFPGLTQQGTSKVDPEKWDPRALELDPADQPLANLAAQLVASPEWQKVFPASLEQLVEEMKGVVAGQKRDLESHAADLRSSAAERVTNLEEQVRTAEIASQQSQAPISPAVRPDFYQVSVRVTARENGLGVPGVDIQLRTETGAALAQAVTDDDGNAVLAASSEGIREHPQPSLVLTPAGTPQAHAIAVEASLSPRPGQVDFVAAQVSARQGFSDQVKAAAQFAKERDEAISLLRNRIAAITVADAERQAELAAEIAKLTQP